MSNSNIRSLLDKIERLKAANAALKAKKVLGGDGFHPLERFVFAFAFTAAKAKA